MQKRSHLLLASTLLKANPEVPARRFQWAFLLGSFQPDCNPLSYLKGSRRVAWFRGHNFANAQPYVDSRIRRLQNKQRWNLWNYYTLGKLTHYVADAFTFPHNETFSESLAAHHVYERHLRKYFASASFGRTRNEICSDTKAPDLISALNALHRQYLSSISGPARDARYICKAAALLVNGCLPSAA